MGWTAHEVRDVLGIAEPVLALDPLSARYDSRPWEPWPADLAARRFLDELTRLRESAAV